MIIETLDGNTYELEYLGLIPKSFTVDPLSPRTTSETIEGRDGFIDIETTYEGRSQRAFFLLKTKSVDEYLALKKIVHKLFDGKTFFYLMKEHSGQRWKVKTANKYSIERINPVTGMFEVELISQSPYAESYLSTLTSDNFGGTYGSPYTFTTSTFTVWNDGDVLIDPRLFPLVINFKGASNNLIIRNTTTGDEWQYSGSTVVIDNLTLDGIRSFKNGVSVFGHTNRKLISLEVGKNDFQIIGATQPFEISFDFRHQYI
jgi:hypothetical protein